MYDYDVIVVGAGNAAFAAAISARQAGAERVVVLEKAPRNMRGGNTHWSGAVLRFAFDHVDDLKPLIPDAEKEMPGFYEGVPVYTKADFYEDLKRTGNGRGDKDLIRILVENSKDTVFWMHDEIGVKMEPALSVTAVKSGDKIVWARGTVIRAEHEGVGLSSSWFKAAEKFDIEIRYSSAVTEILQDDRGNVSGVRVRTDDGIEELYAPSIVLGCGGFEANVEMRTRYIGPLVGQAKVRGTPYNQGDGLRMALAVGALPWGQWSGCHATPISADWGDFAPRALTDKSNRLSYMYGVMLNRRGHRFVDEGENEKAYTYAKFGRLVLAQPGTTAFQLFDSQVVDLLEPRYSTSTPIVSDTLEGLIAQLDIDDKKQALKTVMEYNAAARNASEGFDPTRLDGLCTRGLEIEKTNWALRLDKPPFYAYTATGGITFTFGGIKITEEAEVVGTDWRPIPGLYACGEMVGGIFYDNYPAGSGLVSGATFGRIAGRQAAERAARVDLSDKTKVAANA